MTGKVQGVFYRQSTISLAQSLNLRGWVRNDPDGTVVGQAAGEPDVLKRFEAFLHEGPSGARVERVDVKEGQGDLPKGFELRR